MFNFDLPRFLPYPTGNINGLMAPDCLAALGNSDSQWWFYVGLLTDDTANKGKHSFEFEFITIENHNFQPGFTKKLAAVNFDFTFQKEDKSFHASSFTGPASPQSGFTPDGTPNFLGIFDVSAANDSFNLSVLPLINDKYLPIGPIAKITYHPVDSSSHPFSLYAGYVGQPGACYDFNARGSTYLTCYNLNNELNRELSKQLYIYEVELKLVDERGILPEGWGGYSGVDLIKNQIDPNRNLSVEYAQPRLRVKSWTIKLAPYKSGSGETYEFGGKNGSDFLWLDRQALHSEPWVFKTTNLEATAGSMARIHKWMGLAAIADEALGWIMNHDRLEIGGNTTNRMKSPPSDKQDELQQLYQGCWFGLNLTEGPYAGISAVFVAHWKQSYNDRPDKRGDYDTDHDGDVNKGALGGFMNLYLGMQKRGESYDPVSAYVLTDILDMDNMPKPYRIQFKEQITEISDIKDPQRWAKTIKITIKGHSQARYALAAYAQRGGREEKLAIDPKEKPAIAQDVVFKLNIVSPHTITTTFGSSIFEGAAEVRDREGKVIGSAWVEQMVG